MSGDFQHLAQAAASRILPPSDTIERKENNRAELLAESLTRDVPTIESAVKSFLSLVAARSLVASQTDTTSAATASSEESISFAATGGAATNVSASKCVFPIVRSASDSNLAALRCARALLETINSLVLPEDADCIGEYEMKEGGDKVTTSESNAARLERKVTVMVWNGLVSSPDYKPSKILGRKALLHVYPYVLRRVRQSSDGKRCEETVSSTSVLPVGVDPSYSTSFFEEFGTLLFAQLVGSGAENIDDDAALLWEHDRGEDELRRRRGRRVQRGEDAARAEKEAKAQLSAALAGDLGSRGAMGVECVKNSSTVTIEEINENSED